MSLPISCHECNDTVEWESGDVSIGKFFARDYSLSVSDRPCPGKGKHALPQITRKKELFGLVHRVRHYWEETRTADEWYEYTGPQYIFFLKLALFLLDIGNESISVNGRLVWRNYLGNLTHEGSRIFS